jgi:hypothetical protein
MTKTNMKKVIALISILGILLTNTTSVFAATVGTITVDSNTASISPDSANINWD